MVSKTLGIWIMYAILKVYNKVKIEREMHWMKTKKDCLFLERFLFLWDVFEIFKQGLMPLSMSHTTAQVQVKNDRPEN